MTWFLLLRFAVTASEGNFFYWKTGLANISCIPRNLRFLRIYTFAHFILDLHAFVFYLQILFFSRKKIPEDAVKAEKKFTNFAWTEPTIGVKNGKIYTFGSGVWDMRKWSKIGQTDPIFWEWIFQALCCRIGQNRPKNLSLPSWWRFRPCRSCFAHKFWAPGTWRSIYQKLYSQKRKKQSPSFKNLKAKPEKYIFIKLFL